MIILLLLLFVSFTFMVVFNDMFRAYVLLFLAITFFLFIQILLFKIYVWAFDKIRKFNVAVETIVSWTDRTVQMVMTKIKG